MATVFFLYIYFCFVNYWDTANNSYLIRTRRKNLELLKILWEKYFWDLNELEYITEKINEQNPHYDPAFFFVGKEEFYVNHVKTSYILKI